MKYYYAKESEVPEAHKALYMEREIEIKEGEKPKLWVLDVEGVVAKERHAEFRETNRTLKAENDQFKSKLEGIDDPEKAKALLKISKDVEIADAEKYLKKGGVEAMVEERAKMIKTDLEKKLAEANSKATAAQAAYDKEKIENALLGCCGKLSLQQGAEVAILKMAEGQWVRKDGNIVMLDAQGNPKPSVKDPASNLGLSEWIADVLLPQHKYLVKESSGGGAGGSGGGGGADGNVNPWKKETFNITAQMQMSRKEPEKAARMKAAAGVVR